MLCMIDEKLGGFNIMFLTKFVKKPLCQYSCCRRKQSQMQEFVGFWTDGGIQPKLLPVDSDHCFVKRNPIRTRIVGRL